MRRSYSLAAKSSSMSDLLVESGSLTSIPYLSYEQEIEAPSSDGASMLGEAINTS
jgi:hypothetical protein